MAATSPYARGADVRVAVVATRCYPELGGIESHLEQVVPRLRDTGWRLQVLVTDRTGALGRSGSLEDVPVTRFAAYPRSRDYYLSPGLFWAVARGRFDVVHVHGVNTLAPPLAMLGAILSRTPFVVTFHSGGANNPLRARLRSTQWRVLAPLLRRAATLVAVSPSEARTFAEVVGPRHPIVVVPNGSSGMVAQGGVERDPDLVVSVGRLERYKGHHLALEALTHLERRRPGARLRILGTGPYEQELHKLAEQLGVADRVEITSVPPGDRSAMAGELAAAGAVALLSDYEAHPVAVLEALSLGCPVVVRRNSGMVDLIEQGLVCEVPDDASASVIADAIVAASDRGPQQPVALSSWQDCADEVRGVLEGVLGPSGAPVRRAAA